MKYFLYVEAKIIYHQQTNLSEMLKEIFQMKGKLHRIEIKSSQQNEEFNTSGNCMCKYTRFFSYIILLMRQWQFRKIRMQHKI